MKKVTLKEAKKVYIENCQKYGSSMCEIKTLSTIFEISLKEAGDILMNDFLEDAIKKMVTA